MIVAEDIPWRQLAALPRMSSNSQGREARILQHNVMYRCDEREYVRQIT
jgi:hypothetical protein